MSDAPAPVTLRPEEEAKRLWEGALQARSRAGDDMLALLETLELGVRAAEILGIYRLQDVRGSFPATIATDLELPVPEVDRRRDAVNVPSTIGFVELLDMLSAEELSCVGPHLHRGWEDRVFSCRRSRETAREATGVELGAETRDHLLLLAAYRNRLFRVPPPVRVVPADILAALPHLERLVDELRTPR